MIHGFCFVFCARLKPHTGPSRLPGGSHPRRPGRSRRAETTGPGAVGAGSHRNLGVLNGSVTVGV